MIRTAFFIATLAGCSAERTQTVHLPSAVEHPVTPVDASLLPPPKPSVAAHACLMLYECGCNSNCIEIDQPSTGLAEGMQVAVASGPWRGQKVFIAKNRTDDGQTIFTAQRADPSAHIMVCGMPSAPPMGYLCATYNSGAARACSSCDAL